MESTGHKLLEYESCSKHFLLSPPLFFNQCPCQTLHSERVLKHRKREERSGGAQSLCVQYTEGFFIHQTAAPVITLKRANQERQKRKWNQVCEGLVCAFTLWF